MIVRYSAEEMLDLWRIRRGLEPLRNDEGHVVRHDGVNADFMMTMEMNAWYDRLLREGPLSMVEVSEIASLVKPAVDGNILRIDLPENCVRVVSVRASEWRRDVAPRAPVEVSPLELNEYAGCGIHNPIAVICDTQLALYNVCEPSIASLKAVMRPDTDSYVFDREALYTVPSIYSVPPIHKAKCYEL